MATNTTITSSFVGTASKEIFVQMMKSSDTISKGLITVLPNVIGSAILPKLAYSDTLHAATCGWNPTGTITLTEKEITTKQFEIANELCKKDFAQTFSAQNLGLFSAQSEIPSDIKEAILLEIVKHTAYAVDNYIWNDSTSGLFAQFVADATVIDVVGATISVANVVAEIAKTYNAIPSEIDQEDDVVIVVSKDIAKMYRSAQASMGNNTTVGAKELDYLGTKIDTISKFPNQTMVAYRVKNLYFATGLESDMQNVRMVDSDETNLDGMVKTKVQLLAGQGYAFGGEIVFYKA